MVFSAISRILRFSVLCISILSLLACQQTSVDSGPEQAFEYLPRVQTENVDGSEAILVKFKSTIGSTSRARSLSAAGLVESATFTLVPGLTIAEPLDGFTVTETLEALAADTSVAYAEPDYLLTTKVVPDDADFNRQYGLNNTGQSNGTPGAHISAANAWDIQKGNDVIVAIIDSGVDYNHPDLRDNIWVNVGEIPNNGIDDDQNGLVDDIRGWDFSNDDNDPMDDNNHGTHIAGVIGAKSNNGTGIAGINWNVKIMPLKFMNSRGSGRTSGAINALEYAVRNGAKVSNNSWGGGPFSQALFDAIQSANNMGHIFIAAAGNDGTNNDRAAHYPSSYNLPNIIAVAATDRDDRLASFSNFGVRSVDLAAPGVNIYSTVRNNGYREMSGTSMAAPFVTGVAALLFAQNSELTVTQLKNALLDNVDNIQSVSGRMVSNGRLNAEASLIALATIAPTLPGTTPVTTPTNPNPVTPVDPNPITTPVIAEVVITPSLTYLAVNATAELIATGGTAPYTWSIDDPSVAGINSTTGIITGLIPGTVIVTATDSLNVSSTAYEINVITMGISPVSITEIKLSETMKFSAIGGVAPFTWQVSDTAVVSMVVDGAENINVIISPITTGSFDITLIDSVGNEVISNVINVIIPPLVLTPGDTNVFVNNSIQLGATGGTSPYIWTSSNPAIASVDDGGLVTTLAVGTTTVSVTDFDNKTLSLVLTVNNDVMTLDRQSAILAPNDVLQLTVTGGDNNFQWTSSDATVASVNTSGLITANFDGFATIIVTDGSGLTATMEVEVRQITVSGVTTMVIGDPAVQLFVSGSVGPFAWSIDNPIFATIDASGLLTAFAAGTVIVTVTDSDGFSGTLSVTINGAAAPAPAPTPTPINPAPAPAPAPVAPTGGHH